MKLPEYTYHKIPPRGFDSAARAERRSQTARDRLLLFFLGMPYVVVGMGVTGALLLVADCVARATS